jgi:hypothetical protein
MGMYALRGETLALVGLVGLLERETGFEPATFSLEG